MRTFQFDIKSCIKVNIRGRNVEQARRILLENLDDFSQQLFEKCNVSEGVEAKNDKD